ncbi:MAG: aminotransferase class V-fold PLP-dependent enzyme [Bacteroidia bacterium]|nr:aminotransferase class V-fold PLP-dependent enzyme [Bacteroidia bacterium]
MENYFLPFRKDIIGINECIPDKNGQSQKLIYADWTASGRNYLPIEKRIQEEIMPLVANTHTETSTTGMAMTYAYHKAKEVIKKHVNASSEDRIISAGSGMTRLINKFQRMLGLRTYGYNPWNDIAQEQKPVVFITHMEHHSNHTSWLETIVNVKIIPPNQEGLVDLDAFAEMLEESKNAPMLIASITACSNVTGIETPYHEIAKMTHAYGGFCFVDFACSAPYVKIDMHPEEEGAHLDAVLFSPHKFLGGPGSAAVLIFNKNIYQSPVPDHPGGGTVSFTSPWRVHRYVDDIEEREDGGTPAFLQTMKTAMAIRLKEEMGEENIHKREKELLEILWNKLSSIPNLHILAPQHMDRLPVISFFIEDLHHNVGVKMLNDRFGIQCRGGCSCAGTYGHYLLNIDPVQSKYIENLIEKGDISKRPGWIRVSLHPTMTNKEVTNIGDCIGLLAANHEDWKADYDFDPLSNLMITQTSEGEGSVIKKMESVFDRPFQEIRQFEIHLT